MKKTSSKKALTAKDLGLAEDVKLSAHYDNTEQCFRTVSDQVLGYYIVPAGRNTPVRVAPLYKADTWFRPDGYVKAMISSYEVGEYFNSAASYSEFDINADALARIAAEALGALERHAAVRVASLKRQKKRKP